MKRAGLLAAAASVAAALLVHGDEPAEKKVAGALPEAVEKALEKLVNAAAELKQKSRLEEMQKVVGTLAENAKLGEDDRKKLGAAAEDAVKRSMAPWRQKFDEKLRPFLRGEVKQAMEMIEQWPPDMLVTSGFIPETSKPEDLPEWKEALKKHLTPEHFAALERAAGDEKMKLEKEIADYLKPQLDTARKNQALVFKMEIEDMKAVLKLPEDRAARLEEASKQAVVRNMDTLEQRWRENLRTMNPQGRAEVMARRTNWREEIGEDEDERTADSSEWKKDVAGILAPQERALWQSAQETRTTRQSRALAMMLIAELDRMLQFTGAQREKLEPVAARFMHGLEKQNRGRQGVEINLYEVRNLNEDEVKTILDQKQMALWKKYVATGNWGWNRGVREADGEDDDKKDHDEAAAGSKEAVDDDRAFAEFFMKHEARERARLLEQMMARHDDVVRVTSLGGSGVRRLELAAKGAVERSLIAWRTNFENWVHSSVQNAGGRMLRMRLAGLNANVNFGEQEPPATSSIWEEAILDVLSPDQKKAWDEAVEVRKQYRERSIAGVILVEMERRYHLGIEQSERLGPLLRESVEEYYGDFNRMFSGGSASVMPRYMLILFAGVPEAKAKEILSPAQWEQWQTGVFQQYSSWWESIKSNHERKKKKS